MDFNGLRLEYALEGSSNYISWKDRMEAVLEDNGLKEFIDKDVPKPNVVDAANLNSWKKKVEKQGVFGKESMHEESASWKEEQHACMQRM